MLINRLFARGVWLPCAIVLHVIAGTPLVSAAETTNFSPSQVTVTAAQQPLRVVKFNDYAHADATATAVEVTMLNDFARSAGVEVEWINVFRAAEALDLILGGAADLSISAVPIDRRDDPRLLT